MPLSPVQVWFKTSWHLPFCFKTNFCKKPSNQLYQFVAREPLRGHPYAAVNLEALCLNSNKENTKKPPCWVVFFVAFTYIIDARNLFDKFAFPISCYVERCVSFRKTVHLFNCYCIFFA